MAGALKLEDFGRLPPPAARPAASLAAPRAALSPPGSAPMGHPHATAEARDSARTSAEGDGYEAGYRAGWDDAVRAAAEDAARIRADFARNLRDLGFTYQEARAQVLSSLEPLLREVTERLLPDLARDGLAPRIVDSLMALAHAAADTPVEIVIAPAARPALDKLLSPTPGLPLQVREEPTLDIGQAVLRLGTSETRIDLAAVADAARDGIAALYALRQSPSSSEERRHA